MLDIQNQEDSREIPLEKVGVKGVKYPVSAVGHECIMHAVLNLPTDYADEVIKWLLEDTSAKIFDSVKQELENQGKNIPIYVCEKVSRTYEQ